MDLALQHLDEFPSATRKILSVRLFVPSVSLWLCLRHKADTTFGPLDDATNDGRAGEAADQIIGVLGQDGSQQPA